MNLTPEQLNEKIISLSCNVKRSDNFYVHYYNFPENIANLLGRQTISLTRPDITFDTAPRYHKKARVHDQAQARFEPITLLIQDDDESLTANILWMQIMRQLNKHKDIYSTISTDQGSTRFAIRHDLFNAKGEVVESYIYEDCFIMNFAPTESMVNSADAVEYSLQIQYDNIKVKMFDEYASVL